MIILSGLLLFLSSSVTLCLSPFVQVGAGGLSVSLSSWSWSGRLFVSRQSDQGRRPGFQQRGQLHVTAASLTSYQVTVGSDRCTSTKDRDRMISLSNVDTTSTP